MPKSSIAVSAVLLGPLVAPAASAQTSSTMTPPAPKSAAGTPQPTNSLPLGAGTAPRDDQLFRGVRVQESGSGSSGSETAQRGGGIASPNAALVDRSGDEAESAAAGPVHVAPIAPGAAVRR